MAVTENTETPAAVGVPEICPETLLSVSPAGSAPALTEKQ